ncbi:MAG: ATP-dependent helicase [Candidatus Wallbacteria bacterium]|nr:ATP-dependent helicase [Candidatus Wallbacteria bacterium]
MNQMELEACTSLNDEQRAVVTSGDGYSLVLAGAGSGKTRTLVYRMAWLHSRGVSLDRIMLLTFTNKAAREMLSRAQSLMGIYYRLPYGGTFHSLANLFLRRFASLIGREPDYTILDKSDEHDLLKECIVTMQQEFGKLAPKPAVASSLYSFCRNSMSPLKEVLSCRRETEQDLCGVYQSLFCLYEEEKVRNKVMDFDDLLVCWHELLAHVEYRMFINSTISHVLVDEYQDTNRLQFEILKRLVPTGGNLLVVGDDAQSIYSFRAAEIRNILDFQEHYPDCRIFRLTTNYRSTPEILTLANASIQSNMSQFPKELKPVLASGSLPRVVNCPDQTHEAHFIVQEVKKLVEKGLSPERIVVLFRARYQSLRLEMILLREGISYCVRGGIGFFEQAHIKDLLAFLNLLINPLNLMAFRRAVRLFPGIGGKSADSLHSRFINDFHPDKTGGTPFQITKSGRKAEEGYAEFTKVLRALDGETNPGAVISLILDRFYRDYLVRSFDNAPERESECEELAVLSGNYTSVALFLSEAVLDDGIKGENRHGNPANALTLSTIHQAKGLEWEAVFLLGLNHDIFPDARNSDGPSLEEERRLFYVAVTRAQRELYLTYPTMIEQRRNIALAEKSLFLKELPDSVYETWKVTQAGAPRFW